MSIILSFLEGLVRTSGDVFHILSMAVLLTKINKTRSCSGISLKSQVLYLCVYLWRYIDIIYVFLYPSLVFSSRRMIYNTIMKCVFSGIQGYIIFSIVGKYYYSYDSEFDDAPMSALLIAALVSGLFLSKSPMYREYYYLKVFINWLWTSSIVLESVSIIPQLVLLQKAGEGESLTLHYVVFLGIYRLLYIVSWIIKWINGEEIVNILIWSSCLQTLLYSNLFVIYIKTFASKGKGFRIYPRRFFQEAFGK
ncbi:ER lumen protein retaining receptor [Nematocida sp. AWRm80]|nr:ER lumen protein retaining receptor [Nematocida sp. AWRm80]